MMLLFLYIALFGSYYMRGMEEEVSRKVKGVATHFTKEDLISLTKTGHLSVSASPLVHEEFNRLCNIMMGREDIEVIDQKTAEIKAVYLSPDTKIACLVGESYRANPIRLSEILQHLAERTYKQMELNGLTDDLDKESFINTFIQEKVDTLDAFYMEEG